MNSQAISLRELAFVRDVLVPRAWVQGTEVDELLRLRAKIDGIFSALREEHAMQTEGQLAAARTPERPDPPQKQSRKPQHPKRQGGQPPPARGI